MALCGETAIVTVSGADGMIQSVDKGCCVMFGYEMHELPGKPIKILVPTPYKEQHDSYMENYHRTGKAKIVGKVRSLEGQHKDGTIFPIRLSVSEVKTGTTAIYIGMIQKLQDTAAIITTDMKGKILTVNQYCEALWGYTTGELIGENVRILMPNPHKDKHDSYLQNYFKTGKRKVIGEVRNVAGQHKNGLIFPICLQVERIKVNDVEYFRGRIERVEEEKEAVFTLDNSGIILSCNGNFVLPLLGYSNNELIGRHINILMPKLYATIVNESLGKRKRHSNSYPLKRSKTHDDSKSEEDEEEYNRPSLCPFANVIFRSNDNNDCQNNDKNNNNNDNHVSKDNMENGLTHSDNSYNNNKNNNNNNFHINININNNNNNNNNNEDKKEVEINNNNNNNNIANNKQGACPIRHQSSDPTSSSLPLSNPPSPSDSFSSPSTSLFQIRNLPNHNDTYSYTSVDSCNSDSSETLDEWCSSGTQFIECIHRDGSCFTVALTLTKFKMDGSLRYSCIVRRLTSEPLAKSAPGDLMESKLSIGKYVFTTSKTIGAGSYGKVFLGEDPETNQPVAVKILQKDIMDDIELERSKREIEIMKHLHHPNICRLFESMETTDRLYIIMEYCPNGELFSYVNSRGKLSEAESRNFFLQMISGIKYCHSRNVVHRDIKHKNILLDDQLQLKIIDFGLSNFTIDGGFRNTFCGTPAYSAPEMILARQYVGPEVDVWSMGVVLYSMLFGEFPFKTVSDIINGNFHLPSTISTECGDAIKKMLCVNPDDRITVDELLKHPFVTGTSPNLRLRNVKCLVLPNE